MFTTIKVVSRHEDTQLYSAILFDELTNEAIKDSESYKEYYDIASGAEPPKTKASVKKKQVGSDKTKTPLTAKGKRHKTLTKAAKPVKQNGSGADEGTCGKLGVPDVLTHEFEDEQISWKSSEEDDDDKVNVSEDDDDQNDDDADNKDDDDQNDDKADNEDDDDQNDDNADNESDDDQDDDQNNDDDLVHPKLSTFNEKERQDEEGKEEEWSDDEAYDNENQGVNVEGEELDEDETNKEDEVNELYRDVNVNLEGRDTEMTDAPQINIQGFISNMLNPNLDTSIDFILNLNTESTSLVDVPVFTNVEMPPSSQTNQFAAAVSLIPGIVDTYLANKMNEAVKTCVQLKSDRLRDEAQAENADFINKLDDNIKKIIKEQVKAQVKEQATKILPRIEKTINEQLKAEILTRSSNEAKTSHAVAANLSELELNKILIDKMEINKSIHRSDHRKTIYKALVDAYESDKLILDTYGDTVTIKRRRDDQDEDEEPSAGSNRGSKRRRARKEPKSTSAQKEKTSKSWGKSKEGSKSHHTSTSKFTEDQPVDETTQLHDWFQKPTKPPTPDRDWNKTLSAAHGPIQPWISNLARKEDTRDSFNELLDTLLDLSAFVMNRLKVDTLTPELLAGPTFELMKGSCKSLVKVEYFLEEVYKATTDQLYWNNPKGQQYPHDLRKPLPLNPNSQGRRVIPLDHFINNDLMYLRGGTSSRTYAPSVTKTNAADYRHVKWIEDLVPNTMESARDVYSRHRIIVVTKLQIVEWHNYKHLDWITVRRNDDKISIVIQRRVEDLQLGVESYQKKLNLTRPDTYRSDLKRLPTYSAYPNPRGFIYQNKDKKNKLMRIDELHKFSDGTLNDVRTALDDILKRIGKKYLPQTYWKKIDKDRAGAMIQAIDKQLKNRRNMRSLEKFIGGRPYEGDFRLPQRTI
ncbi:hypothetical protein Tco_0227411 [Tanacetum coccineum]